MAVETCRRERAATPYAKIGLLCFNRHLGAHLTDVSAREGLTTVRAGSFYAHIDQVLGDVSDAAATDPAYFRARVQRATEVAQVWPLEAKFDLLVIDEGQDLRDDASKLAFMDAILKGGLKDGRWWWFEDLDQILSRRNRCCPRQRDRLYLHSWMVRLRPLLSVTGGTRNRSPVPPRKSWAVRRMRALASADPP